MRKIAAFTIISLFGVYGLWLQLNGNLGLYIHPRYFLFNSIAAAVCLLVGLSGIGYELYEHKLSWGELRSTLLSKLFKGNFVLLAALAVGFLVVPAQLSTRAASQRASNINSIVSTQSQIIQDFIADTENFNLGTWVSILNRDPVITRHLGKKVRVIGFIFRDPRLPTGQFLISRFVVRCCVVDATPIGLPVSYDLAEELSEQQWVEVRGEFASDTQGNLVIRANTVTMTEKPEIPYIY